MAKEIDIEALRREYVKSYEGRLFGRDPNEFLVGAKGLRIAGEGLSSAGSTFPSTSTVSTLTNHGYTLIGTTGSSGTSVASTATQQLPAPDVGVRKTVANISTATVGISTVTASAYFMATASSTYQYADFAGRSSIELLGVSTQHWLVLNNYEVASAVPTSAASTETLTITKRVTFS